MWVVRLILLQSMKKVGKRQIKQWWFETHLLYLLGQLRWLIHSKQRWKVHEWNIESLQWKTADGGLCHMFSSTLSYTVSLWSALWIPLLILSCFSSSKKFFKKKHQLYIYIWHTFVNCKFGYQEISGYSSSMEGT